MEMLFDFKGEINNQVLRSILKTMDDKMADMGEDRFLRKKINSILIECLQNLIFHAEKAQSDATQPGLLITKQGEEYEIITTNLIPAAKAETLSTYIDRINAMNDEELRVFYQQVLTNGRFNPQGGAGLGIINIARKTKDHKVKYDFLPSIAGHLMFQMSILI